MTRYLSINLWELKAHTMKLQQLIVLTLLLGSTSSHAELYKWFDEEGNIHYSDTPPHKDATPITPPQLTTTPALKVTRTPAVVDHIPAPPPFSYSEFRIQSPGNDETVRNNEGNVSLQFSIKPNLNSELKHSLSVLLDGKVVKRNITSSSTSLSNIDRGTHTISAEIHSSSGTVIRRSSPVTIHVHRQSSLFNNNKAP